MRYVVSESQFRKLSESILNESKEIKGCMVFKDMNQREFCRSAEKLIADEIKRKAEEAAKEALAAKKAKEEKEKVEKGKNKEKTVKVKEIAKTNDTKEKIKETPTYPELSDEAEALSNDFANNRGKLPWPIT